MSASQRILRRFCTGRANLLRRAVATEAARPPEMPSVFFARFSGIIPELNSKLADPRPFFRGEMALEQSTGSKEIIPIRREFFLGGLKTATRLRR
jgi:hypothetical protein